MYTKHMNVGLLIIRGDNELVKRKLRRLLELAMTKVRQKLYIQVEEMDNFREMLSAIYLSAASIRSPVDLRVLLDKRAITVDGVFYDEVKDPDHPAFPMFKEKATTGSIELEIAEKLGQPKPYGHVVMGGTFDRLHNGHKVLLSEAILLARERITCGITDGQMNRKKVLYELIEHVEKRCREVASFVEDVSGTVKCFPVPIFDPFGPSIVGNDMQAIVVSEETLKGGEAVNSRRKELGLKPLAVHVVKLVGNEELQDRVLNETKISSSAQRRQMLGTILREPKLVGPICDNHYVIGLTGGIASGKTHIAKYLASQGCEVIECDALVHKLYAESGELRNELAREFGESILTSDGGIDRQRLSDLVFRDKCKLKRLNEIVWPLAERKVAQIVRDSSKEIVVVDAALLLEAGWHKFVHQVWTVFVPREEAIKRICARDKVPIERASERLDNQLGNGERIANSNAVFCSLWDYSETERQVAKALERTKREYIPKSLAKK